MSDTSEMVERVARAIAGHFGPEFDELPKDRKAQRESIRAGDAYCDNQSEMLAAARAAIEAMGGQAFWLWRNGDHWLAFDTPHPTLPGGDPRVLGEPEFALKSP
jgi:hypothetical protein